MLLDIFSYGGGVQSVAICALIYQGKIPKPDKIVIIDTGYERGSTWRYMETITQPAMRSVGLEIERIYRADFTENNYLQTCQKGTEQETTYCLLPVFNKTAKGTASKASGFCSHKMKRDPFTRYLKKQGVKEYRTWLGFSADEMRRAKDTSFFYPLISRVTGGGDILMNRGDCIAEIKRVGWAVPHKSSCYICPHMRDSEWRELPHDEIVKAAAIESEIQKINEGYEKYLHRSLVPITEVKFQESAQDDLHLNCDSGMCFI